MKIFTRKYNSKILLFGEYSLISGSKALILPFRKFNGGLEFSKGFEDVEYTSNINLKKFSEFLDQHQNSFPDGLKLDTKTLLSDIESGLFLRSDIPQGYGAGSSGVVVAALYETYAHHPVKSEKGSDLLLLKNYFSFMESFFHGRSSGIDPLSCFIGKPLLMKSADTIEIVALPRNQESLGAGIFLIDTGMQSKTGGLVEKYIKNTETPRYRDILNEEIIPAVNNCIDSFLRGKWLEFSEEIKILSGLQMNYFTDMIPLKFKELWAEGIETGNYSLKLCGSGGGGFLLGFASDLKLAVKLLENKSLRILKIENSDIGNPKI